MRALPGCLVLWSSMLSGCTSGLAGYHVGGQRLNQADAERVFAERADQRLASEPGFDKTPAVIESPLPVVPQVWSFPPNCSVTVKFTITAEGKVADPTVVGSPSPDFAALSLQTIMRWRFSPAVKEGVAVPLRVQQVFEYKPQ